MTQFFISYLAYERQGGDGLNPFDSLNQVSDLGLYGSFTILIFDSSNQITPKIPNTIAILEKARVT